MIFSDKGFLRPHAAPSQDALSLCPGRAQIAPRSDAPNHPLWGPVLQSWRGWAHDEEIRFKGASGGVLSVLLVHLCQTGQIDAVLHCGADDADPSKTVSKISETRVQILENAGSRYAPSATLSRLGEMLDTGLRFAVVGKPCDIDAVARMRAQDPELAARMPILLSFFCAGVPSQRATETLIAQLRMVGRKLAGFRYRGHGWPGHCMAIAQDGDVTAMSYRESWGTHLSPHLQARCKLCADGIGMSADVVCADAWSVDESGFPSFQEAAGVSAVLARTPAGQALIEAARKTGAIETQDFDLAGLEQMQPGQVRRRRDVAARLSGVRWGLRRAPKFRNFTFPRRTGLAGIRKNFRTRVGTFLRVLAGRL